MQDAMQELFPNKKEAEAPHFISENLS